VATPHTNLFTDWLARETFNLKAVGSSPTSGDIVFFDLLGHAGELFLRLGGVLVAALCVRGAAFLFKLPEISNHHDRMRQSYALSIHQHAICRTPMRK
jgi:hypothetical protein